ncbi:hypothetical protein EI94DRAFT_1700037 [Lactarius quietus]|nr:hypothetical protein EI94DRAFT_1700037 [Lactarius quietus]
MSYLVTLVVFFLATLSVASPVARQAPGFQCDSLDFSDFTIDAVDTNDPLIKLGLTIATSGSSFTPIAIPLVVPSNIITETFNMIEGGLNAIESSGHPVAISAPVSFTNSLLFLNRIIDNISEIPEARGYCVQNVGGTAYLAVNGDAGNFAICDSSTDDSVVVVYNPQRGTNTLQRISTVGGGR